MKIIKDALLTLSATAALIFCSFACAGQKNFTLHCTPTAKHPGVCSLKSQNQITIHKNFAQCTFPKDVALYSVTQFRHGVKQVSLPTGGQTILNVQKDDRFVIKPNKLSSKKNLNPSNQYTFTCKTRGLD